MDRTFLFVSAGAGLLCFTAALSGGCGGSDSNTSLSGAGGFGGEPASSVGSGMTSPSSASSGSGVSSSGSTASAGGSTTSAGGAGGTGGTMVGSGGMGGTMAGVGGSGGGLNGSGGMMAGVGGGMVGAGGAGGTGPCSPTMNDSQCVVCVKGSCCSNVTSCAADVTCSCYLNCLENDPNPMQCFAGCPPPDQIAFDLNTCAGMSCAAQCGGGVAASSSSSGGGMCPLDPNDVQCIVCAKNNCCAEYTACLMNPASNCTCWIDCINLGGDLNMCAGQCGAPDQLTTNLGNCSAAQCPGCP